MTSELRSILSICGRSSRRTRSVRFLERRRRKVKRSGSFTPSYHQEQEISNRKIGYTLVTMSAAVSIGRSTTAAAPRGPPRGSLTARQRHSGGDGIGSEVVLREVGAPPEIRAARSR